VHRVETDFNPAFQMSENLTKNFAIEKLHRFARLCFEYLQKLILCPSMLNVPVPIEVHITLMCGTTRYTDSKLPGRFTGTSTGPSVNAFITS
jgi:hypothetical protein